MGLWDGFNNFLMQHNPFGSAPQQAPSAPPAAIPMNSAASRMQASNDAMARRMGFTSAAQATAYYQKQQDMRSAPAATAPASSGGSWLDQQLSKIPIHPSYLLGHVLSAWNQADGTNQ